MHRIIKDLHDNIILSINHQNSNTCIVEEPGHFSCDWQKETLCAMPTHPGIEIDELELGVRLSKLFLNPRLIEELPRAPMSEV